MKEQKPKKHSLSSSLPLSSHVSTSFYLSPLPFILDLMCHRLIKCVKNFLFCTSLCKALAWMLLPKFTLGLIWAPAHGWRVFQFFTSAK